MKLRKKLIALLLALCAAAAVLPAAALAALPGDVNGDGGVDRKDRIHLARYLSDWEGYGLSRAGYAADVNGDGSVDRKDRIHLARYLSGWTGYDLGGPALPISTITPAPAPTPTPEATTGPAAAAKLPELTDPITYPSILALMDAYAPDGAWILRRTDSSGGDTLRWIDADSFDSSWAWGDLDTAVHEQCHEFTDGLWGSENIYTGGGSYIVVPYTEVFDSIEMVSSVPESLRAGRFDTYVNTDERYMASRQYGAYGLLDEFTAYRWGTDTYVKLYDYYKNTDLVLWGNNGYVSYAEFRYYILHYMLYAREHHPDVYEGILHNDSFRLAFSAIDDQFAAVVNTWRTSGRLRLFYEDEYGALTAELSKPEYVEMAALLRP